MTIPARLGEAVKAVSSLLKSAGVDSARLDARLIVSNAAGLEPQSVLIKPEHSLSSDTLKVIENRTQRRIQREPLSHILGVREFWSLDFKVNADTLTPRADTETLIETVLKQFSESDEINILDLGTGSGCILLTLLSELTKARGVGVDISEAALTIAKQNAQTLGLSERASFQQGQWAKGVIDKFDVVVSNPPYIPSKDIEGLEPEVAIFEPKLALDGGIDGLDAYRAIAKDLSGLLLPGGIACFEVGIDQATDVGEILIGEGFSSLELSADLSGIDRIILIK